MVVDTNVGHSKESIQMLIEYQKVMSVEWKDKSRKLHHSMNKTPTNLLKTTETRYFKNRI